MISLLFCLSICFWFDMFLHMAYSLYAQIPLNVYVYIYIIHQNQRFIRGSPTNPWVKPSLPMSGDPKFFWLRQDQPRQPLIQKSKTEGSSAFCGEATLGPSQKPYATRCVKHLVMCMLLVMSFEPYLIYGKRETRL